VRFMLGNLNDFAETDVVDYSLLNHVDKVMTAFQNFTNNVLSAVYFNVVKDRLYNDAPTSASRRSVQSVLFNVLNTYTVVIAPVACHTAEEIYEHYNKPLTIQPHDSVFKIGWPAMRDEWNNAEIKKDFDYLMALRTEVNSALEIARQDGAIRSPQEADLEIYVGDSSPLSPIFKQVGRETLALLYTTSQVTILSQDSSNTTTKGYERTIDLESGGGKCRVVVRRALLHKCPRCRKHVAKDHDCLCERCQAALL